MSLLLDLLFPRRCYGCRRLGTYFCPGCITKIHSLPIKTTLSPRFDGLLSVFKYHDPIRTALFDLKYHFITDLVDDLTALALSHITADFPNLVDYWQTHHFVLIPVPLHSRRHRWRGFNQSELLGRQIASGLKLAFCPDLLLRSRSSPPQVSLPSKTLRRSNLASSFSLKNAIPSSNFLLFDDVSTTGSTLLSAASAFPASAKLWALTVAG